MDHNIEKEILEQLDFRTLYSAELEGFEGSDGLGEADCPFCDDGNHSLQINLNDGNFACIQCGAAGSILNFFARLYDIDEDEAIALISEINDADSEPAEPEIETDEEGPDEEVPDLRHSYR
ncbi:MAG: CHC2 zinc finger domain-containing protein [Deltaproteobacteria bacterium]